MERRSSCSLLISKALVYSPYIWSEEFEKKPFPVLSFLTNTYIKYLIVKKTVVSQVSSKIKQLECVCEIFPALLLTNSVSTLNEDTYFLIQQQTVIRCSSLYPFHCCVLFITLFSSPFLLFCFIVSPFRRSYSIDKSPGSSNASSPISQRKDINRSESLRVVSNRTHRIFRPSDLIHGEVLGKGCFGQAIKVRHILSYSSVCEVCQHFRELMYSRLHCPEDGSIEVSKRSVERQKFKYLWLKHPGVSHSDTQKMEWSGYCCIRIRALSFLLNLMCLSCNRWPTGRQGRWW